MFIVHGCHHKLRVIDGSALIYVNFIKHFVNLFLANRNSSGFRVTFKNLLFRKLAVSILINLLENFLKLLGFFFSCQLTGNKCKSRRFKLLCTFKILQILKRFCCNLLINLLFSCKVLYPGVLKSIFSGNSIVRVVGKHSSNKILGFR
jgi:hypothetical protein